MPEGDLFERGLEVRREVLGAEYVDASMASADEIHSAVPATAN